MKMKFNWGHGIALTLILFIAFIVVLVRGTFQQRIDLTSEDYYNKEVVYDKEKQALERGLNIGEPAIAIGNDFIDITLPQGNWAMVSIDFNRPDNADYDLAFNEENVLEGTIRLKRPELDGWWNINIEAIRSDTNFRWETKERL